jgi:hypothetical protein
MSKTFDFNHLCLTELNKAENHDIYGGGIGKELGNAVGWLIGKAYYGVEAIGQLDKIAMDYQHSLPANLKK